MDPSLDTRDFCLSLAVLVSLVQKIIFPPRTLFHFISPHGQAERADSRAGSPFSVSLVITFEVPTENNRAI